MLEIIDGSKTVVTSRRLDLIVLDAGEEIQVEPSATDFILSLGGEIEILGETGELRSKGKLIATAVSPYRVKAADRTLVIRNGFEDLDNSLTLFKSVLYQAVYGFASDEVYPDFVDIWALKEDIDNFCTPRRDGIGFVVSGRAKITTDGESGDKSIEVEKGMVFRLDRCMRSVAAIEPIGSDLEIIYFNILPPWSEA